MNQACQSKKWKKIRTYGKYFFKPKERERITREEKEADNSFAPPFTKDNGESFYTFFRIAFCIFKVYKVQVVKRVYDCNKKLERLKNDKERLELIEI